MALMALFALLIFITFAVVGGLVVLYILRNQPEPGDDDQPPRGFPRDEADR